MGSTPPGSDTLRQMYIDLMKKAIINLIYPENELRILYAVECARRGIPTDVRVMMDIRGQLEDQYAEIVSLRSDGRRTAAQFSHSMIGWKRLTNIEDCAKQIFADGIAGDFVETGVWRGGATIFMRGLMKAFGQDGRKVWVCDSFRGLPAPEASQDDGFDFSTDPSLAISREVVEDNFKVYDLLDENVVFVEGWFSETLSDAPIDEIALLRLDGDLYKSTMDALEPLYDKVAPGGFILVDDYGDLEPCRRAIHDFREARRIEDPIHRVDWTGVYWRKGG
jgi:hypothetical protein